MKKIGFIYTLAFLIVFVFNFCKKESKVYPSNSISETSTKEEDSSILKNLREEIIQLSKSDECTGSEEWKIVGLGTKPCGGPSTYIAYDAQAGQQKFLEKVKYYNQQDNKYNQKWGLVSDCSVPSQPKSAECVNGKAKFIY